MGDKLMARQEHKVYVSYFIGLQAETAIEAIRQAWYGIDSNAQGLELKVTYAAPDHQVLGLTEQCHSEQEQQSK